MWKLLRSVYYGHYVVLSSFLLHFTCLGIVYSAGLYVVPLEREFPGSGRAAVGWIPSLLVGMMVLLSYPSGILFDGFIRRKRSVKVLFALGGVIIAAGLVGGSYATNLVWAIVAAFVAGVGLGLCGTTATSCVQPWYDKRRGMATGLAMSGSGLGNFIYALAVQSIMDRFNGAGCADGSNIVDDSSCGGWRVAMRLEGVFSMVLILAASAIIRAPMDGEAEATNGNQDATENPRVGLAVLSTEVPATGNLELQWPSPEENAELQGANCSSDMETSSQTDAGSRDKMITEEPLRIKDDEDVVGTSAHLDSSNNIPQISLADVLRTRAFFTLLLFKFTFGFAYLNFFGHVAAFATDAGISPETASIALSSVGISSVVGRLCLGHLADRFGRVLMLRGSMFLLMACAAAWQFCVTVPSLFALCVVYGFNAGGYPSLPPSIIADYYGKLSPSNLFQMVGLCFTVETPGVLGGIPLVGLMYDHTGSYRVGSIFTASVMFLGNIFLWSIPSLQSQRRDIVRQCSQRTAAAILNAPSKK